MYINPRAKVFAHLDRLAQWRAGAKPAPVTIEWDLSNRCSLGCQACHFAHTHSRGPWTVRDRRLPMAFESTGDLADTALVTRALREVADAGVQAVVWTGGGEPTLHPDWENIVRAARGAGLQQGMYTLGGHLNACEPQVLKCLMTWIVVSLDAVDVHNYVREKGSGARFDAACDGIRRLSRAPGNAVVGVSFLLHQRNWTHARDMIALARELGASYTTFRPSIHFHADAPSQPSDSRAWINDAMPLLLELERESDVEIDPGRFLEYHGWSGHGYETCYGVRLNTTITPDGRVWLCPNRRGVAGSCLGDLRDESFADIWARHPGRYAVDDGCRVMCRLHAVNQTLSAIEERRPHEAFV